MGSNLPRATRDPADRLPRHLGLVGAAVLAVIAIGVALPCGCSRSRAADGVPAAANMTGVPPDCRWTPTGWERIPAGEKTDLFAVPPGALPEGPLASGWPGIAPEGVLEGEGSPESLSQGSTEVVLSDTDKMIRGLFVDELVPGKSRWRLARISPAASARASLPVARAPFGVRLTTPSGCQLALRGTVWRTTLEAGIVAEVDGESPPEPLDVLVPVAAIRWPSGYLDAVPGVRSASGDGYAWWHSRAPAARDVLGMFLAMSWPLQVRGWSDARVVAVTVTAVTARDRMGADARPPSDFIADTEARRPRGKALASAQGPARPTATPLADLSLGTHRWVGPQGMGTTGLDVCVNEHTGGLRDMRLRLIDEPRWTAARQAEGVPPPLLPYLRMPADQPTAALDLRDDPVFGNAVAGLAAGDRGRNGETEAPLIQWVLGDDYLALTVVSRYAPRYYADMADVPWEDHPDTRTALTDDLYHYLGPYGRSLALVPVDIRGKANGGRGFIVTPRLDTPCGILGDQKVGDMPWGRCRIYVDRAILHIVFDLPKEE